MDIFKNQQKLVLQYLGTRIWCQTDPHNVVCPEQKKNLYTFRFLGSERQMNMRPNPMRAVRCKLPTRTSLVRNTHDTALFCCSIL
jgi:hypothetical protein